MQAESGYWDALSSRFGGGWNRFWFLPSDPYTLGPIRLLMGALLVFWHASYTPDLARFFGRVGLLPVKTVGEFYSNRTGFSYLNYLSTTGELAAAHWIGLAILVLFTIGFASRITSVLSLIVALSYIHRGPMLTSQAEPVMTLVLAYLCLGPSGASWSVDGCLALRKQRAASAPSSLPRSSTAATVSLRLIQVHLALLVGLMALSQLMGETWWQGQGAWMLAARTESRLFDLSWLHRHEYLVNFWTHAIVLFELSFALLIWHPLARPLLLAAAALVWTSLAILTGNIPFTLALLIAALAFVPGETLRSCCRRSPRAA